jgi:hypothetical protein
MHLIDPPEYSAMTYVPRTPELALVTGVGLVHDGRAGLWLDVSPFGDPALVPVEDVTLSRDGGTLAFGAAGERYEVRSDAPCDRILFAAMADLASRAAPLRHHGKDRIEVLFEHGLLESLRVGRYEEGDPDAYFTVIFRTEGMFFVRAAPHERVKLRTLAMDRGVLTGSAQERELRYEVDADPYLLDLLGALIATALKDDGSFSR